MKNLKNNKGFSLVELIIVVAIMAILIGILAPQYLKYVEKSRVTSDEDIIDTVRKAVETVASDPDVSLSATSYAVTITDSGVSTSGISDTGFTGAFDVIVTDKANRKWKSKTYKGKTVTVTLEFDTNNMPKITVSDPTGGGAAGGGSGDEEPGQ